MRRGSKEGETGTVAKEEAAEKVTVCVQGGSCEQKKRLRLMADAEEKGWREMQPNEEVLETHVVRVGGEKGGRFHMLPGSWEGGRGGRPRSQTHFKGDSTATKPGPPGGPKVQKKEQSVKY